MLEPLELFDRGFLHPGRNAKFQVGFDVSGRAACGLGRNFGFSGRFWPSCALGSRVGWALSPTDGRSAKQKFPDLTIIYPDKLAEFEPIPTRLSSSAMVAAQKCAV